MLSILNSDHHMCIADNTDIYIVLRFAATCTTIRKGIEARVAARHEELMTARREVLLKNVAVRLTTDFQQRFSAFPDLAHTVEVGTGSILHWNAELR